MNIPTHGPSGGSSPGGPNDREPSEPLRPEVVWATIIATSSGFQAASSLVNIKNWLEENGITWEQFAQRTFGDITFAAVQVSCDRIRFNGLQTRLASACPDLSISVVRDPAGVPDRVQYNYYAVIFVPPDNAAVVALQETIEHMGGRILLMDAKIGTIATDGGESVQYFKVRLDAQLPEEVTPEQVNKALTDMASNLGYSLEIADGR